MDIYGLQGVVVIEMQNVMVPFNGVASEASRAMPSDVYSASTYERGYYGEGVVIAVLDTGVDNEHRALNDFDDVDDEPDSDATSYNDQKWVAGLMPPLQPPIPTVALTPMTARDTAPTLRQRPLEPAVRNGFTPAAAWEPTLVDIKVLRIREERTHKPRLTASNG